MPETNFQNARILIVDDQEANIRLLQRILAPAGYVNLKTVRDPRQVLDLYMEFQPDLILLDLHMPYLDGLEVMGLLEPRHPRRLLSSDSGVDRRRHGRDEEESSLDRRQGFSDEAV